MGSLEKCCCCIGGGSLKELSDSVVDQDLWLFSMRFFPSCAAFRLFVRCFMECGLWDGGKLMVAGLFGTVLVIFMVVPVIVGWRFWIEMF